MPGRPPSTTALTLANGVQPPTTLSVRPSLSLHGHLKQRHPQGPSLLNPPPSHNHIFTIAVPRLNPVPPVELSSTLSQIYGPSAAFRTDDQLVSIESVLDPSKNVIIVLPTGGGKSLAITLPTFLQRDRVTIVILPYVALRDDLLARCRAVGLQTRIWHSQGMPNVPLVLVTPESAVSPAFITYIHELSACGLLARVYFDECHTLVVDRRWRPAFSKLSYIASLPVQQIFMSATLPRRTFRHLCTIMNLHPANTTLHRAPTHRPNVKPIVVICPRVQLLPILLAIIRLQAIRQAKTLVFVCGFKELNALAKATHTRPYSSELEPAHRRALQDEFVTGRQPVMIATSAFGTGLDVPGVTIVIHYNGAFGLLELTQQAGRAGRRGENAQSILLLDPQSAKRLDSAPPSNSDHHALATYAFTPGCRRTVLSNYFDGVSDATCSTLQSTLCDNCTLPQHPPVDLVATPSNLNPTMVEVGSHSPRNLAQKKTPLVPNPIFKDAISKPEPPVPRPCTPPTSLLMPAAEQIDEFPHCMPMGTDMPVVFTPLAASVYHPHRLSIPPLPMGTGHHPVAGHPLSTTPVIRASTLSTTYPPYIDHNAIHALSWQSAAPANAQHPEFPHDRDVDISLDLFDSHSIPPFELSEYPTFSSPLSPHIEFDESRMLIPSGVPSTARPTRISPTQRLSDLHHLSLFSPPNAHNAPLLAAPRAAAAIARPLFSRPFGPPASLLSPDPVSDSFLSLPTLGNPPHITLGTISNPSSPASSLPRTLSSTPVRAWKPFRLQPQPTIPSTSDSLSSPSPYPHLTRSDAELRFSAPSQLNPSQFGSSSAFETMNQQPRAPCHSRRAPLKKGSTPAGNFVVLAEHCQLITDSFRDSCLNCWLSNACPNTDHEWQSCSGHDLDFGHCMDVARQLRANKAIPRGFHVFCFLPLALYHPGTPDFGRACSYTDLVLPTVLLACSIPSYHSAFLDSGCPVDFPDLDPSQKAQLLGQKRSDSAPFLLLDLFLRIGALQQRRASKFL